MTQHLDQLSLTGAPRMAAVQVAPADDTVAARSGLKVSWARHLDEVRWLSS